MRPDVESVLRRGAQAARGERRAGGGTDLAERAASGRLEDVVSGDADVVRRRAPAEAGAVRRRAGHLKIGRGRGRLRVPSAATARDRERGDAEAGLPDPRLEPGLDARQVPRALGVAPADGVAVELFHIEIEGGRAALAYVGHHVP